MRKIDNTQHYEKGEIECEWNEREREGERVRQREQKGNRCSYWITVNVIIGISAATATAGHPIDHWTTIPDLIGFSKKSPHGTDGTSNIKEVIGSNPISLFKRSIINKRS